MSIDYEEEVPLGQGQDVAGDPPQKVSHKSFRRKYRKIMVTFEEKMRESNNLFKEEQRIMDISRRLSEQNDQILELLYDLNRCPQIPPRLRYNLEPRSAHLKKSESAEGQNGPQPAYDSTTASATLREARHELRTGEMALSEYQRLTDAILESPDFVPQKSLVSLSNIPISTTRTMVDSDPDQSIHADPTSGFPTSSLEEQYLQGLDAYLVGSSTAPRAFATGAAAKGADRVLDRDRDLALRNPVSVYNWLRKHQPQVFLQDNEAHSEKAPRGTTRVSKRASALVKQEPELYDEDGIAVDMSSSGRGKRKRDDDGGYRPKGGNARPSKRRKEEGLSVKKTRKPPSAASTTT